MLHCKFSSSFLRACVNDFSVALDCTHQVKHCTIIPAVPVSRVQIMHNSILHYSLLLMDILTYRVYYEFSRHNLGFKSVY